MELSSALRVVSVDRLSGSVILTFNDGRCGMYSPDLLYAMLASALELHESGDIEEEPVIKCREVNASAQKKM